MLRPRPTGTSWYLRRMPVPRASTRLINSSSCSTLYSIARDVDVQDNSGAPQPSCHVIVNERGIGRHCVGEAQCLAIREWLKEILTHKRFAASEGHHAKFRHLRQLIEKALRFVRR